jgi:hypothetical protein
MTNQKEFSYTLSKQFSRGVVSLSFTLDPQDSYISQVRQKYLASAFARTASVLLAKAASFLDIIVPEPEESTVE